MSAEPDDLVQYPYSFMRGTTASYLLTSHSIQLLRLIGRHPQQPPWTRIVLRKLGRVMFPAAAREGRKRLPCQHGLGSSGGWLSVTLPVCSPPP